MSLTKEMIIRVEEEIQTFDDTELLNYHYTYNSLNRHYTNSYYIFRINRSLEEINRRGLDYHKYIEGLNDK